MEENRSIRKKPSTSGQYLANVPHRLELAAQRRMTCRNMSGHLLTLGQGQYRGSDLPTQLILRWFDFDFLFPCMFTIKLIIAESKTTSL